MRKIFTFLASFLLVQVALAIPRDAVRPKQSSSSQQEIHLNFDHFTQGPKYYKSGDWYVVLENEEDWEVYLNWQAPKDNYCGTFTTEQFLDDYSYIFTPEDRQNGGIHYNDINMTISVVEINPALEQIVLDATIQGKDGNTYIIHATHDIIKAKDEVECAINDAVLTTNAVSYTISAQNSDWDIALSIKSKQVIGTYTSIEHFDMQNTHFVYQDQPVDPLQLVAQITVEYQQDGLLTYVVQCTMLGADTVIYHLQLMIPLPSPTDTLSIACSNMRIDDTYAAVYNMMTISASNSNYEVQIIYNDTILRASEYTEADAVAYITDLNTYEEIESLTTRMHITHNTDKSYSVYAEVRCTNNLVYQLQLAWNVPTPTDTVQLRFAQSAKASYYPQMNNDLLLINANERYTLDFNVVGVGLGQEFNLDNIGTYYTLLRDEQKYLDVEFAQVQGRLYQSGDTTYIIAQVIGFDAVLYDIELWYAVPLPTQTIDLNLTDVTFENHLAEGYFQFVGYTDDQNTMISFTTATFNLQGTYVNDGLFGLFGQGKYDFFNDYTYVAEWNASTNTYDAYTVEKGELIVSLSSDGIIEAQASVICENAKQYNITFQTEFQRPHLQYDTQVGNIERIYCAQDEMSLYDYTQEDGLLIFEVTAANQSDMLILYFFVDSLDQTGHIPVANYTINSSLSSGTVLASTGVNEDNTVSPSLYTTMQDDYFDKLYFLVDGTVHITKNNDGQMRLEVNAVNSYDQSVHIIYDPALTDLLNVSTGGKRNAKQLINGQLFIHYDGNVFNAAGQRVK